MNFFDGATAGATYLSIDASRDGSGNAVWPEIIQ